MKLERSILHLILSILFIAISVYPCADKYVSEEVINQSAYQAAVQQDNHSAQTDFCSPLCVCNCCSTSLTIIAFADILPAGAIYSKDKEYAYYPPSLSDINRSIWQPPKIMII